MEGSQRTYESDVMHFCIIVIETAARKLGVAPSELVKRLERHRLIEDRLMRFYDTLHTQSADYAADDLIETLNNRENGR